MASLTPVPAAVAPAAAWVPLLVLLALVVGVYLPGLHGPFLFDDFPNLLQNRPLRAYAAGTGSLADALSAAHAGPLGRPLSVLSLALQARWHGLVPFPFKLFNLLVHALNTCLVLTLVRQLLTAVPRGVLAAAPGAPARPVPRLAALTAALWAVHPLALTPILLVVQRMTSLSTLGLLIALCLALRGRALLAAGRRAGWTLWAGVPAALLWAVLSKETALLFPCYLAAMEATVLAAAPLEGRAAGAWRRFVRVFAWLPLGLALLALPLLWSGLAHGFQNREFTLAQRLLTESRVVWLYLRWLLLPQGSELGLHHDDIPLSRDLWTPASTLPALLGLFALTMGTVWLRRRQPWLAFASAFFLASQLLESTVVPLELVYEHRTYLGMLGPLLVGVLAAWEWLSRLRAPAPTGWIALAVLLTGFATWQRAWDWGDALTYAQMEALHHPDSVRAQYELANLYGDLAESSHSPADRTRLFAAAEQAARRAIAVGPREAQPRIGLLVICALSGCAVPSDTAAVLAEILRSDHRTELMASDLVNLAPAVARGECPIPPPLWRALNEALAANPALTPRAAVMVEDTRRWLARAPDRRDGARP